MKKVMEVSDISAPALGAIVQPAGNFLGLRA